MPGQSWPGRRTLPHRIPDNADSPSPCPRPSACVTDQPQPTTPTSLSHTLPGRLYLSDPLQCDEPTHAATSLADYPTQDQPRRADYTSQPRPEADRSIPTSPPDPSLTQTTGLALSATLSRLPSATDLAELPRAIPNRLTVAVLPAPKPRRLPEPYPVWPTRRTAVVPIPTPPTSPVRLRPTPTIPTTHMVPSPTQPYRYDYPSHPRPIRFDLPRRAGPLLRPPNPVPSRLPISVLPSPMRHSGPVHSAPTSPVYPRRPTIVITTESEDEWFSDRLRVWKKCGRLWPNRNG